MRRRRRKVAPIGSADTAAITAFARAYLHEDHARDYGDAIGAACAFRADASPDERRHVARALGRVAEVADATPTFSVETFFAETVRCAWRPKSAGDVRALALAIRAADSEAR